MRDDGRPLFVLVGGGARSGKSRLALARARALGARRLFVATADAREAEAHGDAEMLARIARHRAERAQASQPDHDGFDTLEEPLALPEALAAVDPAAHDVVLVDCLTLWLSNLLCAGATLDDALGAVERLRGALARRRVPVVLVTNEVGLGLVPETPLGRAFRDAAGIAHQRLAADADEVHVGVMGLMLRVRPEPVTVVTVSSGG